MNLQIILVATLLVVFVHCQQEYLNDFDNQGDNFGQDDVYQEGENDIGNGDDYRGNDPVYEYARGTRLKRQAGHRVPVRPENFWWVGPAFNIGKSIYRRFKGRRRG